MFFRLSVFALALRALVSVADTVQPEWAQCGGINWSGGTTCAPGLTCVVQNPYYSQCLRVASTSSTATSKLSTTSSSTSIQSTASSNNAVQPQYAQCGGMNWSGGTTCAPGLTCFVQNPYYSQCLMVSSTSSTTTNSPTPVSSATSSTGAVQPQYAQCGGMNWSGGTQCAPGLTCVVQNPYYSQCLMVASTSSTTSSTTSANSANSATSSTGAVQPQYAQCGGMNWSGGTQCAPGLTCVVQNPYYSQCLMVSSTSSTTATTNLPSTTPSTSVKPSSSSITPATSSSTTSTSSTKPPTSSASTSGPIYKASMTHYGAGDSFGSPNCNTNTAACGFYTYPGYSAAVSQNLYGVGPGAGAGPACGTCWKLIGQTDYSGAPLSNAGTSIIVMVNNLCPAQGNPLCAQSSLTDTNQYGANVNFDLCSDSGAQAAFFGNDGQGLAVGTAQQVDCSLWSGTIVH